MRLESVLTILGSVAALSAGQGHSVHHGDSYLSEEIEPLECGQCACFQHHYGGPLAVTSHVVISLAVVFAVGRRRDKVC